MMEILKENHVEMATWSGDLTCKVCSQAKEKSQSWENKYLEHPLSFSSYQPNRREQGKGPFGSAWGRSAFGSRKQADEERWSRGQKKAIQNNVIHDSK